MVESTFLTTLGFWSPAGGNTATGSSLTNLDKIIVVLEQLPGKKCRMTFRGKFTATTGTTSGYLAYNGFFNAGGNTSNGPLPVWAMPKNKLPVHQTRMGFRSWENIDSGFLTDFSFAFSLGTFPECVFTISTYTTGTAFTATDIIFDGQSFVYETL